jgi:arylformamidase
MCLAARWDEDYGLARDPLAAAVLVSGIYDIEPLRRSYLQADDPARRRHRPPQLADVRRAAVRDAGAGDLGRDESAEFARQATQYHAAWQGARQPRRAAAAARTRITSRQSRGSPIPGSTLSRWIAARLGA